MCLDPCHNWEGKTSHVMQRKGLQGLEVQVIQQGTSEIEQLSLITKHSVTVILLHGEHTPSSQRDKTLHGVVRAAGTVARGVWLLPA